MSAATVLRGIRREPDHFKEHELEPTYVRLLHIISSIFLEKKWKRWSRLTPAATIFQDGMKRPQLIAPGSLNRMLQAAEAAWHRKDFQECLETLERASRLAPANTGILLQLGRVHGLRYDYAAAERCFEQALRLAPQKTGMLTAIAEHCQNFRNPDH